MMFHTATGQVTKRFLRNVGATSNVHLIHFTKRVNCATTKYVLRDSPYLLPTQFQSLSHRTFHFKYPVRDVWFKPNNSYIFCRNFHLSDCRRAAPILPVIGAVLARFSGPIAQFLKLTAVVAGRTIRKWWSKLPDQQKEKFKTHLFSRKELIAGILSILTGGWLFLYYIHLEETPYTKRSRYVGVTPKQLREIWESQWRNLLETYAENIIPVTHPDHKRVFQITKRLLTANRDEMIDHMNWEVNVIESDDINAFVLPREILKGIEQICLPEVIENGQIFVFTGLLRFLADDDSLAVILGHEIAHAVLQHSAEQLCFNGFVNLIKVVLLATTWALIPSDFLAALTQFIQNAILGLFWHLPYSRTLEEEADKVGLYFAAKACFDVRQGPNVWQKFGALEKLQDIPSVEWLSTHPSHENRERHLESIVPEALALRKICQCPELSGFPNVRFSNVKPLTLSSVAGINYNRTS